MPGSAELRRELNCASAIRLPAVYRDTLERLKHDLGHAISILDEGKERITRFNCFAYALGIWAHPDFIAAVDHANHSAVFQSAMVQAMIDDGALTEIAAAEARPKDVVIYLHQDKVTHAAVVKGQGVYHSKWGGIEVHAHGLWEVPAPYGDQVRYFGAPEADAVLSRLPTID